MTTRGADPVPPASQPDAFETALRTAWRATPPDPAHDIAHIRRVWANAALIAQDHPCDLKVLRPAVVFHDLVTLPKDAPDRHLASQRSADGAMPILRDLGVAEPLLPAIHHAIEAHSFSRGLQPKSPEAAILRDADRLDALGAIGLARVFSVSGALGRPLYDPEDPFADTRPPDDSAWALDHFQTKLLSLKDDMLTKAGKHLAAQRTEVLSHYLTTLAQEIGAG